MHKFSLLLIMLICWTFTKYFSAATCDPENNMVTPPLLCTAPIKVRPIYWFIVQPFRSSFSGDWLVSLSSFAVPICKSLQSQLQKDRKRIAKASIDQPEIRLLLRFVFWWITECMLTLTLVQFTSIEFAYFTWSKS